MLAALSRTMVLMTPLAVLACSPVAPHPADGTVEVLALSDEQLLDPLEGLGFERDELDFDQETSIAFLRDFVGATTQVRESAPQPWLWEGPQLLSPLLGSGKYRWSRSVMSALGLSDDSHINQSAASIASIALKNVGGVQGFVEATGVACAYARSPDGKSVVLDEFLSELMRTLADNIEQCGYPRPAVRRDTTLIESDSLSSLKSTSRWMLDAVETIDDLKTVGPEKRIFYVALSAYCASDILEKSAEILARETR